MDTARVLGAGLAALSGVVALHLIGRRLARRQDPGADIPIAPAGVIATVRAFSNFDTPTYALGLWHSTRPQKSGPLPPIFRVRFPVWARTYMVTDPSDARAVLTSPHVDKTSTYRFFDMVTGGTRSVFSAPSDVHWRAARKAMVPAFRAAHVERMNRVCLSHFARWRAETLEPAVSSGAPLDICDELIMLTIGIICEAGFGYAVSADEARGFLRDLELTITEGRLQQVPLRWLAAPLLPAAREARRASERNVAFARRILDAYRHAPEPVRAAHARDETLVSMVAESRAYETERARCADMITLLFAGHDTTALSIAWALVDLAQRPAEQAALRAALRRSAEPTRAPELLAVVKESMRLNPVAAMGSFRRTAVELSLPSGHKVAAGSWLLMPYYLIHRGGQIDEPEEFRPSRWAAHPEAQAAGRGVPRKDEGAKAPLTLPFAAGPRNCVGQALAYAELHAVLASLCAEYEFELSAQPTPYYNLTWRPKGAMLRVRHALA